MHILPVLRRLEHSHPDEVIIIGVHSGKFTAERKLVNLRPAVRRLEIDHPVVNDNEYRIWQEYGVRAWPTLMFIDPEGKVIGKHEGEIRLDALGRVVAEMLAEFEEKGLIDRERRPFEPVTPDLPEALLRFPGKVYADASSGRLFIADTGHNRVLVADLDGRVLDVIGSGEAGLADGSFADCRFNHPQGMARWRDDLLVADTGSHAIRLIRLAERRIDTVAGTGEQAVMRVRHGPALETSLSSPWDISTSGDRAFIAMAGLHQIWELDLNRGMIGIFAGTGHEGIKDGPLEPSWFAQPSGLSTDDGQLFVADSESSAIRSVGLAAEGRVETIAGLGLFEFGDVDGVGDVVRLQHPLGVIVIDGTVFIADTYNNKVKRAFPLTKTVTTFAGSGQPGNQDGPAREASFHGPEGLSAASGHLYVADTDNHAIRTIDLASGAVSTLELTMQAQAR